MRSQRAISVLVGAIVAGSLLAGGGAILSAHRCQWHVRLRRQIRGLPEHRKRERV